MKKIIAAILVLAIVFAFTACKNKSVGANGSDDSTAEQTGKPGDYVTDKNGAVETTLDYYWETDKNGEPLTEIVTNEEGSSVVNGVTKVAHVPATYPAAPGQTIPPKPTMPAGNTVKSNHEAWPSFDYMAKIPKAVATVDRVDHSKTDLGEVTAIWINEMSYANFLKYIESCKAVGFTKSSAATPPAKEVNGEYYAFVSQANGLYLTVLYSTEKYSGRLCDVMITVANYDVANSMSELGTGK